MGRQQGFKEIHRVLKQSKDDSSVFHIYNITKQYQNYIKLHYTYCSVMIKTTLQYQILDNNNIHNIAHQNNCPPNK